MTIDRRGMLAGTIGAALAMPGKASAVDFKPIPQRPSVRVIADNDYAGDPDALVALAHQVLSPKARTVLVTGSALDRKFPSQVPADQTARIGTGIAAELIERLGLPAIPTVAGSEALGDLGTSPAAQAIVAEAMREDKLPLVFTCGGPLTNLAAALELEPRIAGRLKAFWIGGGDYPEGGWEYNLMADLPAARRVLGDPSLELTQIPQSTYRQMQMSIADMQARLRPISPFTQWLYDRFTSPPDFVDVGGAWPMGDTPTVVLGTLTQESSAFETVTARTIKDDGSYGTEIPGRRLRVCTRIDARLAFDDFLALLILNARKQ
jgi:hypothetical protein